MSRLNKEQVNEAFQAVFATDNGRIIMAVLEEFACFNSTEFCEDPRRADFIAGRRSVVSEIKKLSN